MLSIQIKAVRRADYTTINTLTFRYLELEIEVKGYKVKGFKPLYST